MCALHVGSRLGEEASRCYVPQSGRQQAPLPALLVSAGQLC